MWSRFLATVIIGVPALAGCASRYETGQALVASGTVVAIVASELATNEPSACGIGMPCAGWYGSTSRHAGDAAAGVAAGVGLAAIGAALEASDPPTDVGRRKPPPSVSPPNPPSQ